MQSGRSLRSEYLVFGTGLPPSLISQHDCGKSQRLCDGIGYGTFWIGVILFAVGVMVVSGIQSSNPANDVVPLGLVITLAISIAIPLWINDRTITIQRRRAKDLPEGPTVERSEQISILDVQRKDTTHARTAASGSGLAVDVGYGLIVGGGGGTSTTTVSTVIGWQFYTSIGIILTPDETYSAWLMAGRPPTAEYRIEREL